MGDGLRQEAGCLSRSEIATTRARSPTNQPDRDQRIQLIQSGGVLGEPLLCGFHGLFVKRPLATGPPGCFPTATLVPAVLTRKNRQPTRAFEEPTLGVFLLSRGVPPTDCPPKPDPMTAARSNRFDRAAVL